MEASFLANLPNKFLCSGLEYNNDLFALETHVPKATASIYSCSRKFRQRTVRLGSCSTLVLLVQLDAPDLFTTDSPVNGLSAGVLILAEFRHPPK